MNSFVEKVNFLAKLKIPFFFLIDFEGNNPIVYTLKEATKNNIFFNVNGVSNAINKRGSIPDIKVVKSISKRHYTTCFREVKKALRSGETFLLNLTFPTQINLSCSLKQLFYSAHAPYKLFYKNQFAFFSPECFVKIKEDIIYTYPMKGTISADIQDAKNTLLNNPKEIYEHNTIVDLLRNDLSMIAKEVRVARFRYIEKIKTNTTPIYQTSSEICGKLEKNWRDSLGELLLKLIPAGSISGAPKVKTIQKIKEIESDERNFYTGVFGIYDGNTLDSGINIRYVEKRENLFFYRSGGGITFLSDVEKEYDEFLNKIYVPVV